MVQWASFEFIGASGGCVSKAFEAFRCIYFGMATGQRARCISQHKGITILQWLIQHIGNKQTVWPHQLLQYSKVWQKKSVLFRKAQNWHGVAQSFASIVPESAINLCDLHLVFSINLPPPCKCISQTKLPTINTAFEY